MPKDAFGPAIRLALYALGVNFVWEMLQAPLFVGMLEMPPWDGTAQPWQGESTRPKCKPKRGKGKRGKGKGKRGRCKGRR